MMSETICLEISSRWNCLWDVVGVAFESGSVWGEGAHGGGAWELRNCCGDWEECEAFGCRWPRGARARCSLLEMQLLQGRPLQFVPRHAVLCNPARAWLTRKSGRIPMLEFHYLKPLGYVRCMTFSQFSDTGRVRVFEDGFFFLFIPFGFIYPSRTFIPM